MSINAIPDQRRSVQTRRPRSCSSAPLTPVLGTHSPIGDVLADLTTTSVDTQHFRLLADQPSGTISLIDVVDAIRGVRDLMYTAAHAAVVNAPMLVQPRPRPPQANQFVRGVRLAAPKAGSFVLSAQVPLPTATIPPQAQPPTPAAGGPTQQPEQSFGRRVVLTLYQAAVATYEAAGDAIRQDSLDAFAARADDGISANLCEAVALIGKNQPFDLRFAWAQSMPLTRATPQLSFDQARIAAIRSAAQELTRLADETEVSLVATVIRLDRVGHGHGTAVLRGALQTGPGYVSDVFVTATLPPHLYDIAVLAHRDQRRVRTVGRLRGTTLHLVRSLEIEGD